MSRRRQIPRGEAALVCPLHRKPMDQVCHKCPWWVAVRGKNPQTGEEADRWDCAIALAPMLTIEVAQQARQTGAAVESFRNELVAAVAGAAQDRAPALGRGADRPVLSQLTPPANARTP